MLDTCLEYSPGDDTWRLVTRLPRPRADHSMLVHDDMVYVIGGWRDSDEGRVLVREVDRYKENLYCLNNSSCQCQY